MVANPDAGGATVKRGLPAFLPVKSCPLVVSQEPHCTLSKDLELIGFLDPDVLGLWFGVEQAIYAAAAEGLSDRMKA